MADLDEKNVGKNIGDSERDKAAKAAIQAGQSFAASYFSERLQTAVRSVYVPVHIGATRTAWSFATTVPDDKDRKSVV